VAALLVYVFSSWLPVNAKPHGRVETIAQQLEDRHEHRGENILVSLTPHPSTAMLIRRGRRVADDLDSSCMWLRMRGSMGSRRFS
jgi:K+-sensing histidine kinase KdpD